MSSVTDLTLVELYLGVIVLVSYILSAITGIIILAADQFAKVFISKNFEMAKSYKFIPGILDITYIHNDGAAWGMLGGYTWLLLSITIVVMLACIALLLKWGLRDKIVFWSAMLVLSGGVGNMIDRIFRGGNVIDFLHFEFWPTFPVFNIADCAIVVGAGLIILSLFKSIVDEQRQKSRAAIVEQSQNKDQNENT